MCWQQMGKKDFGYIHSLTQVKMKANGDLTIS